MSTTVFNGFEWDSTKAGTNLSKHGVSFVEAASVFGDPNAFYFANGSQEGRLAVLGYSNEARLVVVIHTEVGERIRIISARRATRRERALY